MAMSIERWQQRSVAGLCSVLVLFWSLSCAGAEEDKPPHRRFEYKYSFKGPYLVQSDGSVPFWTHSGNAIPSADQIRITPSLKSQKGSVWTKTASSFENWEVEVTFRVTGRGRIGADGLAIWYAAEQGLDGEVYGAANSWNGVGIFFDSFDNDGKKNNPVILVVGNNGKLLYDHQNDGASQALASCQRDFRNKPYPVRAKIIYYKKTLTVMINNGFTPDKDDYEFCAKVDNMVLPPQGFFGISAATGGLADDHDALSFLTFQLTEPSKDAPPADGDITKAEKDKYQEEFDHFQQELDKRKDEYQKDHPELQEHPVDDIFESVNERELRQIFEGQNRIHLEIKQLNRQLDMILDEQRRYVNAVSETMTKTGGGNEAQQASQQELDILLNGQREVLKHVSDMRMERDATFIQKKAERATLRVHLREKYRLPQSEKDENQIQMAGDDVDLPEDLQKMMADDQVEEEEKNSFLGNIQNIQNMDMDTLKEKATATFTEIKQAAEEKCLLM